MMAWTGFGWLGYAIIIGTFIGSMAVLDLLFGNGFARQHAVLLAVCTFAVSSALSWPIGRYFNRHLPVQVFDADWAWRGRTTAHSTFFVRLEFAGLVGLPILIIVAVGGLDALTRSTISPKLARFPTAVRPCHATPAPAAWPRGSPFSGGRRSARCPRPPRDEPRGSRTRSPDRGRPGRGRRRRRA